MDASTSPAAPPAPHVMASPFEDLVSLPNAPGVPFTFGRAIRQPFVRYIAGLIASDGALYLTAVSFTVIDVVTYGEEWIVEQAAAEIARRLTGPDREKYLGSLHSEISVGETRLLRADENGAAVWS